CHQHNNYPWTF
nr:immunoglobulin light chain junction region [Macaca mulatta]MOV61807.1 immunoglobulin light chain junction region [Macaca mulatta]MOV63819.1 immunoglobulin light chain junction region [Macaca mulatta]